MEKQQTSTPVFHLTELGNTERMLQYYGQDIRFCGALGFLVWNGRHWKKDAEIEVRQYCVATIKNLYKEASELSLQAHKTEDDTQRKELADRAKALLTWARASETSKMITAMVTLCKPFCVVEVAQFDKDPYLLNFSNGTVDVRTGTLKKHNRNDYITMCLSRPYNPNALNSIPVFSKFFSDIFLNRESLEHMMHKALGLGLTGDISEQCWFMLIGEGSNGKSTLMTLMYTLLEEYAHTLDPSTITISRSSNGGSATPDIAALRGKRLVICSETEQGAIVAAQLIKRMTGNDPQTARNLYKDPFQFYYTHKLFLFTNHPLAVRETGHAFWRRLYRVPFDYTASAETLDKDLPDKMLLEAEGVLAWLVEGSKLWYKERMERSREVTEATDTYRESEDILGQFVKTFCKVGKGEKVKTIDMRNAYNKWAVEEMGLHSVSMPVFQRMMTEHKFKYARVGHAQERVFTGLSLVKGNKRPVVADSKEEEKGVTVDALALEDSELAELAKL